MLDFRFPPEAAEPLIKRADELLELLGKLEVRAAQIAERLHDPTAMAARVAELEATVEKRLGGATAELIEAREEYRKARNAEQRARDQSKAAPSGGAPEISEEELEELEARIRQELRRADARGGEERGLHPVRGRMEGAFDDDESQLDEFDLW